MLEKVNFIVFKFILTMCLFSLETLVALIYILSFKLLFIKKDESFFWSFLATVSNLGRLGELGGPTQG